MRAEGSKGRALLYREHQWVRELVLAAVQFYPVLSRLRYARFAS
jgi:hypothetical protein